MTTPYGLLSEVRFGADGSPTATVDSGIFRPKRAAKLIQLAHEADQAGSARTYLTDGDGGVWPTGQAVLLNAGEWYCFEVEAMVGRMGLGAFVRFTVGSGGSAGLMRTWAADDAPDK